MTTKPYLGQQTMNHNAESPIEDKSILAAVN